MGNHAALIRAEHAGKAVTRRGRRFIEFENPGGSRTWVGTIERLHLADNTTEIDTAWVADTGAWQWKLASTDYQAHARSVFNVGNIYEWRKGEQWIIVDPQSINWVNQDYSRQQIAIKQAITGVVSDATLKFANAYGTGIDFEYTAHPQRLIKHITIASAANLPAPTVTGTIHFEAEWTLTNSTGVGLYLDGVRWARANNVRVKTANRIEFRSLTTGEVLWYADAPTATDATGLNTAYCEYEVRRNGGTYFITVRVPKTWIDAAAFPIVIDPTFTDGYGGDATTYMDNYIASGAATTNNGSNTNVYIGEWNTSGNITRTLIRFDFSSFDGTETFTSATLSLYCNSDLSSNARTFLVYRQKRAWVEAEATYNIYSTGNNWSTAGGFHADDCEQTDIGSRAFTATETTDEYKDWSLTPDNSDDIDLGFGWLIKANTETNDAYRFDSSDSATTAARPKLVVVYTEGGSGRTTKNTDAFGLGIGAGISRRVKT